MWPVRCPFHPKHVAAKAHGEAACEERDTRFEADQETEGTEAGEVQDQEEGGMLRGGTNRGCVR